MRFKGSMKTKARVIAYYLPQFHPIPENDKYWGKGFTEWTNVAKAKPLFKGHHQPNIPADLGFYDLRLPDVRESQAELARKAGIEGFCYWHYWFGNGKTVLERPFNEVLYSGKPDFPFCLGWANHSWTNKTWEKGNFFGKDAVIFEQLYPGESDDITHFYSLLPAFKDKRYILVEGKPLFVIFDTVSFPNFARFKKLWNDLAIKNGLKGVYFVGVCYAMPKLSVNNIHDDIDLLVKENFDSTLSKGYDGLNSVTTKYAELKTKGKFKNLIQSFSRRFFHGSIVDKYKYDDVIDNFITPESYRNNIYPQLIPGYDRSPRAGRKAVVYYGRNPKAFSKAIKNSLKCVINRDYDHRLIFLNAWNEWGEGAYMEPDLQYGLQYIETLAKELYVEN